MSEFVHVERSADAVATIRIDRPPVNAFSFQVLVELVEAAGRLAQDRDVRAVVIWGGPTIFSAGIDVGHFTTKEPVSLRELLETYSAWTGADITHLTKHGIPSFTGVVRECNSWITAIARLPQITVSAINGAALGAGLGLALATDFRVAARDATLGLPEIRFGMMPGCGTSYFLPRLVGTATAKEMIYGGDQMGADEGLRIGLVSKVCTPNETYGVASEIAARYAAGPVALQFAKQALQSGLELSLDQAIAREVDCLVSAATTADAVIGLSKFLEPDAGETPFTGR